MATIRLTEASCIQVGRLKGLVIAPLPHMAHWLHTARVRWQHSFTRVFSSSGTGTRTFNGSSVTILGGMFSWSEGRRD